MAEPCSCAADYGFLLQNLDLLGENADAVNIGGAKANVTHICNAADAVEQSCGVNTQPLFDRTQELTDTLEALLGNVLVAARKEMPTDAQIALSGGELTPTVLNVINRKGYVVTGSIASRAGHLADVARDVHRTARGIVEACDTPACNCAKARAGFDVVSTGLRYALGMANPEDIAAVGSTLREASYGIAEACGLPPPPESLLEDLGGKVRAAVATAPGARQVLANIEARAHTAAVSEIQQGIGTMLEKLDKQFGRAMGRQTAEDVAMRRIVAEELRILVAKSKQALACPEPLPITPEMLADVEHLRQIRARPAPTPEERAEERRLETKLLEIMPPTIVRLPPGTSRRSLTAAELLAMTNPIEEEVLGTRQVEQGATYGQEEESSADAIVAGILAELGYRPPQLDSDRGVLEMFPFDPQFEPKAQARWGLTPEQLRGLTARQFTNVVALVQSNKFRPEQVGEMGVDALRGLADTNPAVPERIKRIYDTIYDEELSSRGLRRVKEQQTDPATGERLWVTRVVLIEAEPKTLAEVVEGCTKKVLGRSPDGNLTGLFQNVRLVDVLKGADRAFRDAAKRVDVSGKLDRLYLCEREALREDAEMGGPQTLARIVSSGESPGVATACVGERLAVREALDQLRPYDDARNRAEQELVECITPQRFARLLDIAEGVAGAETVEIAEARLRGLPPQLVPPRFPGRLLEAVPFIGVVPEADVVRFESARDDLVVSLGTLQDYMTGTLAACRDVERPLRPPFMPEVGERFPAAPLPTLLQFIGT